MQAVIIQILLYAGVVIICLWAFITADLRKTLLLLLVPVGAFLLGHPYWVALASIVFYFSRISPPIFPVAFTVSNALAAVFVITMVAKGLKQASGHHLLRTDRLALLYGLLLLFLIAARGSGFRMLGSDKWGGAFYLAHFTAIGFYIFSDQITVNPRRWRRLFLWMLALSVVRPVAEALFMFSGGRLTGQFLLVRPEGSGMMMGLSGLSSGRFSVFRFHALSAPSLAAFIYALYCYYRPQLSRLLMGIALAAGVVLAVFAGYRIAILQLLMFLIIGFMSKRNRQRLPHFFIILCATVVFYAFAFAVAPHLPLAGQRVLSILPGISVSGVAEISGEGTVKWRYELWTRILRRVPEYLWVGRGLVFSQHEFDMLNVQTNLAEDNYDYQFWTHEYHNGPLAILVDFGMPGALICACLLFCLLRETTLRKRSAWRSTDLKSIYQTVWCYLLVSIITFMLSFGDTRSIMGFLFQASLLRITAKADALAFEDVDVGDKQV